MSAGAPNLLGGRWWRLVYALTGLPLVIWFLCASEGFIVCENYLKWLSDPASSW